MSSFRKLMTAAMVLAVIGLFVAPGLVLAQSANTGAIDGRVFDESKAAMPGATVTVHNESTGLTRTSIVSSTGTYHIAALPAGTYTVSVEMAGFGKQTHPDVAVQVASTATVDFTLKVAS